jgi:hypothetical protein
VTLVEFLRARLDEDERAAQAGLHSDVVAMVARQSGKNSALNFWRRHDPARVLRRVAAERRIVDEFVASSDPDLPSAYAGGLETAVRLLALVHADHPDCRAEWAAPAPG